MLTQQPTTTAWPEGVTARYLTTGGAHVHIRPTDNPDIVYTATCTGCTEKQPFTSDDARNGTRLDYVIRRVVDDARAWAQGHAASCRAEPNPNGQ
jgi:hypothetical protein